MGGLPDRLMRLERRLGPSAPAWPGSAGPVKVAVEIWWDCPRHPGRVTPFRDALTAPGSRIAACPRRSWTRFG
jgi:hypothetical protein